MTNSLKPEAIYNNIKLKPDTLLNMMMYFGLWGEVVSHLLVQLFCLFIRLSHGFVCTLKRVRHLHY